MKTFSLILKSWLPLAATITLICGVMYALVQQTYRSNANDPQVQIAEDAAYALSSGTDPKTILSNSITEIARSLKPYIIIYDDQGNGVAADGLLDGKIPTLPSGVLDFTRSHGEDAVSWQPRSGVRSALVIKHVEGSFHGFVVAGRSLRMVEEREGLLVKQVVFGWLISLGLLLAFIIFLQTLFRLVNW